MCVDYDNEKIIEPQSAKFRFRLLPADVQSNQIDMIAEKENVKINQNAKEKLIQGNILTT